MKRWIRCSEDYVPNVDDRIREALKNPNRKIAAAEIEEILYNGLEVGDSVGIEESDGNVYKYKLTSKSNHNGYLRLEFEARLSPELAYETNGYVATTEMADLIMYNSRKGRFWAVK